MGTAFSLLRVCAKKKPCFAPPLASLYRVCGGHVTRNAKLNGNDEMIVDEMMVDLIADEIINNSDDTVDEIMKSAEVQTLGELRTCGTTN